MPGKFRVLLSEEAPVVCERNVPVQLEEGNRAEAPFCGYPQRTETMTEHGWRIAEIEAVSGTVLLDMEKRSRVFRGREANLPRNCRCGHGGNGAQRLHSRRGRPGDGRNTHPVRGDRLEIPQENGVPDGTAPCAGHGVLLPAVLHGAAGGEKKELGEVLSCRICFDGRYYAVSGRCTVDRKGFHLL